MVFTLVAPCLVVALLASSVSAKPRVYPSVHKKLRGEGSVDIILTLKCGVTEPLDSIRRAEFRNRGDKLEELVIKLQIHAKNSQKSIDAQLAKSSNKFKFDEAFWVSNQRLILGASADLVEQLADNEDIDEISEEIIVPPPQISMSAANVTAAAVSPSATNELGVKLIGAPLVWALGYKGQNVVVGSIDTGVLAYHAALQANWRSTYGWFDPTAKKPKPYDDQGHGTHTMGTAASIIPIFANGNNGPTCGSANSPGDDSNVIAVGATNITDGVASFSSMGPSIGGLVKPEVSAPGVDVRSSWNSGSNAYVLLSGNSMATPHVAGLVARLLSKKPTLTYDQIKTALISTTETVKLEASGLTCGGTSDPTYPNNQYGYGRVNALTAIAKV